MALHVVLGQMNPSWSTVLWITAPAPRAVPPTPGPPKMQLSNSILLDFHMDTGGPAQAFLETSRHEADGPRPLGRRYACLCDVESIELKDDAGTDE